MAIVPILPVGGVDRFAGAGALTSGTSGATGGTTGFKDVFGKYLNEVNGIQQSADKSVRDLTTGNLDSLHQVVVALNEADLSFQLMMQMRNKLIDAYREIMRMQV
jgi:flagellar hook-basal body complex protein FliE